MSLYSIADIVSDVRIAINENASSSGALDIDIDNLELEEIIKQKILDAIQLVNETAPTYLIDGKKIGATPIKNQDGSGYIVLPDDFMRLVIFRMDGWKRPVTSAMQDSSPDYILQKNKYVRGGIDKPKCAITTDANGKKILEYYSLPGSVSGHIISVGFYIPYPSITNNQTEISDKLYRAVIYVTASLTMTALEKTEYANYLMEISKMFMNGSI